MSEFHDIILRAVFSSEHLRDQISPYLSEKWFLDDTQIRSIVGKVLSYMEKYGEVPTIPEMKTLLRNDASLSKRFDSICSIPEEDWNCPGILEEIEEFIRRKLIYQVGLQIQEGAMDSENEPSSHADELAEAESFSFSRELGLDLVEDMHEVYEELSKSSKLISTGLETVDYLLAGGVPSKVLIGILAPTNVGKTLIMSAIASNMLVSGHSVLYVTFEDSKTKIASRMIQNINNISLDELKVMTARNFAAIRDKLKRTLKADKHLKIIEMEECAVSAAKLNSLLKNLREAYKFVPEVIFIDYVGCMIPNGRVNPNLNSNSILQKIVAEVRGSICMKLGIPVITAFQTNRGGYKQENVDLKDIADSFGSTTKVDVVISVTQTDEMRDNMKYKLTVAKTRLNNNKGESQMVGVEIMHQKIFDLQSVLDELKKKSAKDGVSGSGTLGVAENCFIREFERVAM